MATRISREKYTPKVRLSLPKGAGQQLQNLMEEREMSINKLVSDLVLLGLMSLRYDKEEPRTMVGYNVEGQGSV